MKTLDNSIFIYTVVIALLTSAVYFPIIFLGFASPDDDWMLLNDKFVYLETFSVEYFINLFTSFNSLQYSPINTIYYKLIFLINGFDPYWYHLGSYLLHLCNTYLCFKLVFRISEIFGIRNSNLLSLITCLLWAIHPFNVESVVWISASKVLLFTTFGLASVLSMTKFFSDSKWYYYCFSLLGFILSCLSKEQAVLIPLIMYAIWLAVHRGGGIREKIRGIYICAPLFIVSIFFGVVTIMAQQSAIGVEAPASLYHFSDRYVMSFYCLCFYVFNSVIPIDLHYNYQFPMKPGGALPLVYFLFPFLFLMLCAYIVYRIRVLRKRDNYFFWGFFFLLNLILCIQIIPLRRPALVADRYMYLPVLGLIVIGLTTLSEWIKSNYLFLNYRKGFFLLTSGYLIYLVITSQNLVFKWQNYNI